MATSEQIAQYQRAQKLIEERLRADLSGLWEKVKNLDSSVASGILQQAVGKLIDKYGLMVGTVAADWFEQLTGERAFVPDSYRVQAWEASVRWAVSDLFQDGGGSVDTIVKRAVFERLSSVAVRHVRQHGRDTIDASVRAVDGVLYARKPSGVTCDFCLMLASRGPVYGTRSDAGGDGNRFHSDCDCVPVPVKGKWQAGRWIGEPAGYDFEKLYEEEYKPYWRENDDIRDVLKRRREVLARTRAEKKQGRPRKEKKPTRPIDGWPSDIQELTQKTWAHIIERHGSGGSAIDIFDNTDEKAIEARLVETLVNPTAIIQHGYWPNVDMYYLESKGILFRADVDKSRIASGGKRKVNSFYQTHKGNPAWEEFEQWKRENER